MINVVSGPPREDSIPTSTANLGVSYSEMAIIAEVYALRQFAAISVFPKRNETEASFRNESVWMSIIQGRREKRVSLDKRGFSSWQ